MQAWKDIPYIHMELVTLTQKLITIAVNKTSQGSGYIVIHYQMYHFNSPHTQYSSSSNLNQVYFKLTYSPVGRKSAEVTQQIRQHPWRT